VKAFIYCAALLCEDCGDTVRRDLTNEGLAPADPEAEETYDSDQFPKGPYPDGGGEADTPQHCDHCGTFLDNPLTGDGETYVRDAFREYVETGRGALAPLREWRQAYDWVWDDFIAITLDMRREEKELTELEEFRLATLTRDRD
jgi:hypothetical protein